MSVQKVEDGGTLKDSCCCTGGGASIASPVIAVPSSVMEMAGKACQMTRKVVKSVNVSHSDTTSQQGGTVNALVDRCGEGKLGLWVRFKANSLNEVNSRDFDDDLAYTRVSLDAESGPTANRRRRKRYSPSRVTMPKVRMNK